MIMQIVIDIPRKTYEHIKADGGHGYFTMDSDDNYLVTKAIFDTKPLPKGHGRIIDESKIKTIYCESIPDLLGCDIRYVKTTDAPTIIEADGGDVE